jgi:hypothetical protein
MMEFVISELQQAIVPYQQPGYDHLFDLEKCFRCSKKRGQTYWHEWGSIVTAPYSCDDRRWRRGWCCANCDWFGKTDFRGFDELAFVEDRYEDDIKRVTRLEQQVNNLKVKIKLTEDRYDYNLLRGLDASYGCPSIYDLGVSLAETYLSLDRARSDLRLTELEWTCVKLTYMPSAAEYDVRLRYSAEAYLILIEAGFPHDVAWPLVALAYWVFLPNWWQRLPGDN